LDQARFLKKEEIQEFCSKSIGLIENEQAILASLKDSFTQYAAKE
jgi:hypothetical protein